MRTSSAVPVAGLERRGATDRHPIWMSKSDAAGLIEPQYVQREAHLVGFGLYIGVLLLLQPVLLWQLAAASKTDSVSARPMIAAFLAATLVGTLVLWRFIFIVPVVFSLACAACLAMALVKSRYVGARHIGSHPVTVI